MPLSQKEATCLREGAGEGAKKDELNPRVRCAFGNVFYKRDTYVLKILLKEFLPKKSLSNNLLVAFLFFSSNRSSCSHKGPKKSLSKKAEEGQKEKGPQKSLSKKAEEGQKEKGPQKRAKKKRAHRRGPKEKEGTLKKARPSFFKERVSTKNEFLQRTSFYKERDSTKNEILQRTRFYKDWDSTKNEILQRTRFYKERDSTKNEILQNEEGTLKKARPRFYTSILQILRMRMPRSYRPRHDRLAPNQDREG